MANTIVELALPAGQTGLTLSLYADGSDTIGNTGGDSLTEATNRDGLYTATVTEALSGIHYAKIETSGGALLAAGWVYLVDDTNTYTVVDSKADAAAKFSRDDLTDITAAAVNAECDTAIGDASLATAAALTTVDGVVDDIRTDMVRKGTQYRYTNSDTETADVTIDDTP